MAAHKPGNYKLTPWNFIRLIFIFSICYILILPSALAEDDSPDSNHTTRAEYNTLPVPVLNVSSLELMTLETLVIDASSSYDPDGVIVAYFFQYDDATESGWVETPVVEHVYLKERFYNIRLKVMDNNGEESNYWETITVNIKDRIPFIIIEEEITVKPNTEVTLEGYKCYDEDGIIINYSWEFEDNTTINGPNATHTFTEPGIYNIFLTILDDDRKTNKSSIRIIVLEEDVSESRTRLGMIAIAVIAVIGVFAILFGKRRLPILSKPSRKSAESAQGLRTHEGILIKSQADSWFSRYGEQLPEKDKLHLPEHADPFIFGIALEELSADYSKVSSEFKRLVGEEEMKRGREGEGESVGKRLSSSVLAYLELATAGVLTGRAMNKQTASEFVKSYRFAFKQISHHEQLGEARYYVPRTREQELLAAFATRKIWVRKLAQDHGSSFTESDKAYAKSIIDLLAKCWKTAHSFKARTLNDQTKLILSIILCEKAGKRHFGLHKIPDYDEVQKDEELDLIEEFLAMYIEIWSVLKFEEYKEYSIESKTVCALYIYELLGAERYLGKHYENKGGKIPAAS